MEKIKEINLVRCWIANRVINRQRNYFENKKLLAVKKIFNLKNFNRAVFFVIIILSIYYLAGVNNLAIKGFVLSDLKRQKNKLIEANNKLELMALTSSSYSNIKERISNLKMVAAGKVSYLTVGAEAMAKK